MKQVKANIIEFVLLALTRMLKKRVHATSDQINLNFNKTILI